MNLNFTRLLKMAFEDLEYPYSNYSVKQHLSGDKVADLVYNAEGFTAFNTHMSVEAIAKGVIGDRYVIERTKPTYYYFDENLQLAKKTDEDSEFDKKNKDTRNYFDCSIYSEAGLKRQIKDHLTKMHDTLLDTFKPEKVKEGETAGDLCDPFELLIPAFLEREFRHV